MIDSMKRSLLFSLTALVLFAGCGKQGGRTLTSASGSIYECLVVIPNATLTAEQLEQISQAQLQPNDGSSYAEDVTTLYDAVRIVMAVILYYVVMRLLRVKILEECMAFLRKK